MYVAPDVLVVLSNLQKNNLGIFASLFGLYSCLISRVRPAHSFFEKKSILGDGVNVNAFSQQFLAWRPLLLRGLSLVL